MAKDESVVQFEVGKDENGTEWGITVSCKHGLSERELAGALVSLGKDILGGKVSFDKMTVGEELFIDEDGFKH